MIGWLRTAVQPDESVLRRAIAAVPYPVPTVTVRTLGSATLGIGTRPDFVDESISRPGTLIAAITGRVDNANELRADAAIARELTDDGNDADVVVAAWRALGIGAVARLRGAFAGIVTDGEAMWWFRDQVGFKPCFFRDEPDGVIVAGEARQVVVAAQIPEEPNIPVAEGMYLGGLSSGSPAALKGVERLPQAAYGYRSPQGEIALTRYWTPWDRFETSAMSEPEAAVEFRRLLEQAVSRSMTGNDLVFLSGGLDSPMVAAYAAPEHERRSGRPLGALSAVFPDLPAVDESELIGIVANRFGIDLHTYRPAAKALDDVERWSQRFGSPVPTLSIPEVYEAYSRVKRLGYGNVLTGEFAELTFGKYPHLLSHLLFRGRWGALARMIQSEHRRIGASRSALVRSALADFVPGRLLTRWYARRGQAMTPPLSSWADPALYNTNAPRRDLHAPGWRRYKDLQLWGLEGCTVTIDADATCAAIAGVTIRRPLADVDLWEFFIGLRAEVKFPTLEWKSLARRSLRGVVPDEILDKKKKTFFDRHVEQQIDYGALERLLVSPTHRVRGVRYDALEQRILRRDLTLPDWLSVRELARVHAFLNAY